VCAVCQYERQQSSSSSSSSSSSDSADVDSKGGGGKVDAIPALYKPWFHKRNVGRTLLCTHGFGAGCTWAEWTKLALPFYTLGFDIIFIDLPGFGDSSAHSVARVQAGRTRDSHWRAARL
jgi:pimeloyl-ACP methyl ester carboxylesterase